MSESTVQADHDPACAVAHGETPPAPDERRLIAVFDSSVAGYLLRLAPELGYRTVLVEPDLERVAGADGLRVASAPDPSFMDAASDVVFTDHHRPELGALLRSVLELPSRWVGVIGSARHTAPHLAALRELGVAEERIARVHRPVGLNIGSKTPAEIAFAILAGLVADRNQRPGGFAF